MKKMIIATCMLKINEVINAIRGLGDKIEHKIIINKVLRSLPQRLESKVFAIEEAKDLNVFSFDEMHGFLTTWEMRNEKGKPSDREVVFMATKSTKARVESEEEDTLDLEESNFIWKLKIRQGKYKGKLPFKCFSCGGVDHFTAKCSYIESNDNDDNASMQNSDWYKKRAKKFKKDRHKKNSFIS